MHSSDDSDIEDAWQIGCSAVIPEKSRERYENAFQVFKAWCNEKNYQQISEKVLLAYFVRRNEKLKSPGSLWAEYSMLKSTIFLKDGIDISKFTTLIAYLKRKNVGYRPRKSKVFTSEDMYKFLKEFPDEAYLNVKLGMIMGIAGACRREELYQMKIQDIQDSGSFIRVHIPNTKTNIERTFIITNVDNGTINYLEYYRKYLKLRPENAKSSNFFLAMRNGKVTNQVVGRNTIGSWPSKIAKCLNLPDPHLYTGHGFRRSSATLLVNKGVDILGLKRHGGWRSSSVAEGYVADSLENKLEFSRKILHENTPEESILSSDITTTGNIVVEKKTGNNSTVNAPENSTFSGTIRSLFTKCTDCKIKVVVNNYSK